MTEARPYGSFFDHSLVNQIFTDAERKPTKIKLKRARLKQSNPGNWKDNEVVGTDSSVKPTESALPRQLDDRLAAVFRNARPLENSPNLVQCKLCRRPVEQSVAANHISACLDKKQIKLKRKKDAKDAKDAAARRKRGEKASDAGDDVDGSDKIRDGRGGGDDGEGRKGKRKANGEAEKTSKMKRKKDEPKAKSSKVKGPVDVERQCGVLLPNGQQCARSLTCKSHSMGAKRAVPGRSKPYDLLLAAYQKQNQAKQQRAAIDANAPLQDDFELANGPIDSEEERDAVMASITRAQPQPLTTETFVFTRSRYQYVRMKEMLHNALGGSRGSGLFATVRITTDQPSQQQQQQQQQQQNTGGVGPGVGTTATTTTTTTNHEFISVGSRGGSTDLTSPLNTTGFDTTGMTGGAGNANGTTNTTATTNTIEAQAPSRRTSSTIIPRRESNNNNNNNNNNNTNTSAANAAAAITTTTTSSTSTSASSSATMTADVRHMVPITQPSQQQPPSSSRKPSVSGVAGVAVPA